MIFIKKISLILVFIAVHLCSDAQSADKMEVKEVYFTMTYLLKKNDTIIALVQNANNLGLENGAFIKAYQTYKSEVPGVSPEKEFREIGSGKIILYDTLIACFVKLYHEVDTLATGDMISIKLNLPSLPYRSIFSDLTFNNIFYTNADKEPLYILHEIINIDNKSLEDSIYSVIIKDLKATYERVKDRDNLNQSLLTKLSGGRFKGRIPLEVIRDVTRNDLESFFLYINTYPATYMSKDFRASESFAGWLVSNSPYSYQEIKKALFHLYKNEVEFNKQLPIYKADIIAEGSSKSIAIEAMELSDKNQFKEAHELADFAIELAYAVNDTANKPTIHICKAQILLNEGKYEEVIKECEKVIKAALLAKDRDIEMQAIIKIAFCQKALLRYKEADKIFLQTQEKLEKYRSQMSEEDYLERKERIYAYRSSIRQQFGEYDKALALLDSAINLNNQINSYKAQIRNADYYKSIGNINNNQVKPSLALASFTKASLIYKSTSDTKNRAIIENDIAYSYYQLGDYRNSIKSCGWALEKLLQAGDFNNAGYSKSLTGSSYWSLGKYDSAVISHKESIELRKKSKDISGQAFSWKQIGEMYKESGSKSLALNAFDSAIVLNKEIKDNAGLADLYNKKGEVFLNDENYKKAIDWFEKANGSNSKSTVEALSQLGSAWYAIDTAKAAKYYEQARVKSKTDGNTSSQFFAARSLALLSYRSQNFNSGNRYYEECISLSKEMNTSSSWAYCLSLKAYRFENQTQLDSALVYYQKAIQIFDIVDKSQSVWQLNNLANVYISKGEFTNADEVYTSAIQLAGNSSNSLGLGFSLQASSFLYGMTAEFNKGINHNDSAISIFNQSGNMIRLAGTYGARGTLLGNMGRYKEAVNSYLHADSLYKEELLTEERGIVYNNIGTSYLGQLDYTNALRYFRQSLESLAKGVLNESYLLVQGNISECLSGLKKTKEAKALLLDIFPKARKMNLNRIASGMAIILGKIYVEENMLPQAVEYFKYARDYSLISREKETMSQALINLGRVYVTEKKTDSAENSFRKSVELVNEYKIANGWESNYELGLLYFNQQKFDSCIVYFNQAVALLDKNSENLYGGEEARKIFNNDPRKSDLYNKITFSYFNTGNIKEAWAFANRSNIAGIKELSGSLSTSTSNEEKDEALKKLLAMQQSRKALESTLGKQEGTAKKETLKMIEILENDYNNFIEDVAVKFPDLGNYFRGYDADEFNTYKDKLKEDVAVALYAVNGNTLMIFTLTKEKLAVDTMTLNISPRIATFIEVIKNTNKQSGTGPLSERSEPADEENIVTGVEFKDISDELYRALIATVYDKIGNKKKLCIIPTGVFSNMPFQCLGKKMPDNSFRFLIEDHSIFYTNKMSIFNTGGINNSTHEDFKSFAAFGVPDATLRFNISEVQNIGKIIGADSTVYADNRATESMAKQSLKNKKIIHFATHGVLNYSAEFSQSYLKLLPDSDTSNGNNGKLTMREIQSLGISDCNMVILSACQTAVSKELIKGWNISPANSFLKSNVKSVVASLWKVADEPTGILMEYFYENLNKSMSKVEALRQAQMKLSLDPRYRHPNYWGAFVLYGEWR